jgi:branched-chain amino acid aminotransferase/4-amino-4-deoxychorismate lyase
MNVVLNGNLVSSSSLKLDINDRSFLYGDGLFETMHYTGDKVRLLEYHLDRLKDGCNVLGIHFPQILSAEQVNNWALQLTTGIDAINGFRLKLIVWRSPGGLYAPVSDSASFLYSAREIPTDLDIIKNKVVISEDVQNHPTIISRFKTLSSLKYVVAGREMMKKDADDIIILDYEGHVSEALYSNIFWKKNNQWYTPDLVTGCVEGTMRRYLIEVLQKENAINIGRYKPDELLSADNVIFSNSLGLFSVKSIGDTFYKDLSIPKQLLPL